MISYTELDGKWGQVILMLNSVAHELIVQVIFESPGAC